MQPGLQLQGPGPRFSVTFAADLDAIESVVEGVMAVAMQAAAAQDRELEIETSLREALANAIIHGSSKDRTKNVVCTAQVENDELLITVTDTGGRLEERKLPDPTTAANLYSGSGRGVHMMKQMMDEVEYRIDPGKRTEVRMKVRPR